MLEIVSQTIDRIYKKKDFEFFREACDKPLELCKELSDYINSKKLRWEQYGAAGRQSMSCYIYFNDFQQGNLKISYNTILKISKVAPLFYLQHEFHIENQDKNRMAPTLDDYGQNPYCVDQRIFDEKINSVLTKEGSFRMNYFDMKEVVEKIGMPDGVDSFDRQVSVEYLLFIDIFELCGAE